MNIKVLIHKPIMKGDLPFLHQGLLRHVPCSHKCSTSNNSKGMSLQIFYFTYFMSHIFNWKQNFYILHLKRCKDVEN